jgi:hypothetical protein
MIPEKRMPPKLDNEIKRLQLVFPKPLILKIDAWRARQPGVPNTSQAIRMLVEMSLDADPHAKKKPKG